MGFGVGLFGRGKRRFGEEDPNTEGSKRVNVNVFSGDTVGETRIGSGNGFFGSGRDTVRIGGFVNRILNPALQTLLQEELEEYTI